MAARLISTVQMANSWCTGPSLSSESDRLLVIDCGSEKIPMFAKRLQSFARSSVTMPLNAISADKAKMHPGIIVSGAPILITEIDPGPYLEKLSFLLDYSNPVLGVCFGHQILGMLHGARAMKCEPSRSDLEIEIVCHSRLWNEIDDFKFNEDHCEAIELPLDWIHLASSRICANEAMRHPKKSLYGVQFHPEISGTNGTQLLKNFCESC